MRAGHVPELTLHAERADWALGAIAAGYLDTLATRLDRTPDKLLLALLELFGVGLLPAQAARCPVVFDALPVGASAALGARAPAGTRLGANVPGRDEPAVFETETGIGLIAPGEAGAPALAEVVSLAPDGDAYSDHTADLHAKRPFTLFEGVRPIAHEVYVGDESLLALTGRSEVALDFQLERGSSRSLRIAWEWWDGESWRPFGDMAGRGEIGDEVSRDGTDGLRSSGRIRLSSACATSQPLELQGRVGHWVRGRLDEPLNVADAEGLPEVTRLLASTVVKRLRFRQSVEPLAGTPPGRIHVERSLLSRPSAGVTLRAANADGGRLPAQPLVFPDDENPGKPAIDDVPVFGSFRLAIGDVRATDPETRPLDLEEIDVQGRALRVRVWEQQGLTLDAALGDGRRLDTTRAFTPLGQNPAIGSAAYLACEDVFARPDAEVVLAIGLARTPQAELDETLPTYEAAIKAAAKNITNLKEKVRKLADALEDLTEGSESLAPTLPSLSPGLDLEAWYQNVKAAVDRARNEASEAIVRVPPAPSLNPLDVVRPAFHAVTDCAEIVAALTTNAGSLASSARALYTLTNNTVFNIFAATSDADALKVATTLTAAERSIVEGVQGQVTPPAAVLSRLNEAARDVNDVAEQLRKLREDLDSLEPSSFTGEDPSSLLSPPSVSWEYWNGRAWTALEVKGRRDEPTTGASDERRAQEDEPTHFLAAGEMSFSVPADWQATVIPGDKTPRRWLRARLASGGYAIARIVTWTDESGEVNTIPVMEQRAPVLDRIEVFFQHETGPAAPAHCLTLNDFAWADQSSRLDSLGASFRPLERVADMAPAIYLGFEGMPAADRLGLWLGCGEDPRRYEEREIVVEAWTGEVWERLTPDDGSDGLTREGIMLVPWPGASSQLARFGTERSWIRIGFSALAEPPRIWFRDLAANAVWAAERITIRDEVLGSSSGAADQSFFAVRPPVLAGEEIWVREVAGRSTPVELPRIRDELASSGMPESTHLDVRRDAVSGDEREAWVRWRDRPTFLFSGPNDRDYVVERSTGRIQFGGGGGRGMVPPAGRENIRAGAYGTVVGAAANVPAGAVDSVLSAAPLAGVTNVRPASGGVGTETHTAAVARGTQVPRTRLQAVTSADYAAMALESSPEVARAVAQGPRDAAGRTAGGMVRLVIVPHSPDAQPTPGEALRARVHNHVLARRPASSGGVAVLGPNYLAVDVRATVRVRAGAEAGEVRERAAALIRAFLHPVTGGPEKTGFPFGGPVAASDLAAALAAVPGLDALEEVELAVDGAPKGDLVTLPPDALPAAGNVVVRMGS
jgi:hypothetical protein